MKGKSKLLFTNRRIWIGLGVVAGISFLWALFSPTPHKALAPYFDKTGTWLIQKYPGGAAGSNFGFRLMEVKHFFVRQAEQAKVRNGTWVRFDFHPAVFSPDSDAETILNRASVSNGGGLKSVWILGPPETIYVPKQHKELLENEIKKFLEASE